MGCEQKARREFDDGQLAIPDQRAQRVAAHGQTNMPDFAASDTNRRFVLVRLPQSAAI